MKPITNNLIKYYIKEVVDKLSSNLTNIQVADLLGISISTIKKIKKYNIASPSPNKIDEMLGDVDKEFLREEAIYRCMALFMSHGWQVGTTDSKCLFDVFATKNGITKRIQVRSSSKLSKNGFPRFKTGRILFNTVRVERTSFNTGDFDLWYFYHVNGDAWIVPFECIKPISEVTMENYYEYYSS